MEPTGLLALATDRLFIEIKGDQSGEPDGMKTDVEGNVYCTGTWGDMDYGRLWQASRHHPNREDNQYRLGW